MRATPAAMLSMLALMLASGCVSYAIPDAGFDAGPGRDAGTGGGGVVVEESDAGGFPGSGIRGDQGTGVLFLIRIDRGTANFADGYAEMVFHTVDQLRRAELAVNAIGVGRLYQPELLYGAQGQVYPAELAEYLKAAAAADEGSTETACTTNALAAIAENLPSMWATGQSFQPFARPLSTLLIVLIDPAARPYGPWEAPCEQQGEPPIRYFGTASADWLNVLTPRSLPRAQVRFLTVTTPENGTSTQQLRDACAALVDFPAGSADLIEASPVAFFTPFATGLTSIDGAYIRGYDFCPNLASVFATTQSPSGWKASMTAFAGEWARTLRSLPPFP